MPRGQDISNFPSLIAHQTKLQKERSPSPHRRLPAKRSHSEDVYSERSDHNEQQKSTTSNNVDVKSNVEVKQQPEHRPVRENPLIKYASVNKEKKQLDTKRKLQYTKSETKDDKPLVLEKPLPILNVENCETLSKGTIQTIEKHVTEKPIIDITNKYNVNDKILEKHVSFDGGYELKESPVRSKIKKRELKQTQSLIERKVRTNSINDDNNYVTSGEEAGHSSTNTHYSKDEAVPVELCDIEPFSGTVFRKVTVRRRRQDMRKIQTVDTGKIIMTF